MNLKQFHFRNGIYRENIMNKKQEQMVFKATNLIKGVIFRMSDEETEDAETQVEFMFNVFNNLIGQTIFDIAKETPKHRASLLNKFNEAMVEWFDHAEKMTKKESEQEHKCSHCDK